MTGGTDARFYGEICDACIRFSPVVFGKEQMKGMHGLNECVETSSLPGAVDFYKTIICDLKYWINNSCPLIEWQLFIFFNS